MLNSDVYEGEDAPLFVIAAPFKDRRRASAIMGKTGEWNF